MVIAASFVLQAIDLVSDFEYDATLRYLPKRSHSNNVLTNYPLKCMNSRPAETIFYILL